jgi:prolyl-tRNA editing enzyme YbaK/EbsC (Cys-tRNA(Pro) deacylase)
LSKEPQRSGLEVVRDFLRAEGLYLRIIEFAPESTRTSQLAAEAIGCTPAEIGKTIAFAQSLKNLEMKPVLVVLSGDKRVNSEKLATHRGQGVSTLKKMSPEEVKSSTGFSIGGVPPFPHNAGVTVVADESLFRFQKVWVAAGATNAVMEIDPKILQNKFGIRTVSVSE